MKNRYLRQSSFLREILEKSDRLQLLHAFSVPSLFCDLFIISYIGDYYSYIISLMCENSIFFVTHPSLVTKRNNYIESHYICNREIKEVFSNIPDSIIYLEHLPLRSGRRCTSPDFHPC